MADAYHEQDPIRVALAVPASSCWGNKKQKSIERIDYACHDGKTKYFLNGKRAGRLFCISTKLPYLL